MINRIRMNLFRGRHFILLTVFNLMLLTGSLATDRNIPNEYTSLNDAYQASVDGDTIRWTSPAIEAGVALDRGISVTLINDSGGSVEIQGTIQISGSGPHSITFQGITWNSTSLALDIIAGPPSVGLVNCSIQDVTTAIQVQDGAAGFELVLEKSSILGGSNALLVYDDGATTLSETKLENQGTYCVFLNGGSGEFRAERSRFSGGGSIAPIIHIDPYTPADQTHVSFINCLFEGEGYGFVQSDGSGRVDIDFCTFYSMSGVTHTAYMSSISGNIGEIRVSNSLFAAASGFANIFASDAISRYNLFTNINAYGGLASGGEGDIVGGAAGFKGVAPEPHDLSNTSDAIDQADPAASVSVDILDRPRNGTPDIGSYEYQVSSEPTPTPTPTPVPGATTMTLITIPPAQFSDQITPELRTTIFNGENTARDFEVSLHLNSISSETLIHNETVNIGAHEFAIVNHFWSPVNATGNLTLVARVTPSGGSLMQESRAVEVYGSSTRTRPLIDAAWVEPGAYIFGLYPALRAATAADVRDQVDAMQNMGVTTIIITYTEYILNNWGPFFPSTLTELGPPVVAFDVVGTILDQAETNGMHVIVGLGRGDDLTLTFTGFNDPQRIADGLAFGEALARDLFNLYGHYDSFYGWYLSHEANDLEGASNFYNPMAEILNEIAPGKPVMVSPAGTPIVNSTILNQSKVDIFAYQDAVGSGYINAGENTYDPQQRIAELDSSFQRYRTAHVGTNKHMWSNLETWEMAGPTYGNPYPADFPRILQQLNIEHVYVDQISAYSYPGFMSDPNSELALGRDRAQDLYRDYFNYKRDYMGFESDTNNWTIYQ